MIRLRGVRFSYDGRSPVLAGADLQIGPGLTLILGPNGCGKSTLLKIVAGVERPDAGTVEIEGRDLWKDEVAARGPLAYVPEQPDLTPYATLDEVLHLVCRLRGEAPARSGEALAGVGIESIADRSIRELSMGQRRRAVLAAAMIGSPRVILLDEPLEAMDRSIRSTILEWIDRHRAGGSCVVIVTHEIEAFASAATRAVAVRDGRPESFDPLPSDPAAKMALLETLARGLTSPARG